MGIQKVMRELPIPSITIKSNYRQNYGKDVVFPSSIRHKEKMKVYRIPYDGIVRLI